MKRDSALGFIETVGLASAIAAADAALKAANVSLIGRENTKGQGRITVKITGEVSAVQAAVAAAETAAAFVSSSVSMVIPRPASGLRDVMISNKDTILNQDKQENTDAPSSSPAVEENVVSEVPSENPKQPEVANPAPNEEPVVTEAAEDAAPPAAEESAEDTNDAPKQEAPQKNNKHGKRKK